MSHQPSKSNEEILAEWNEYNAGKGGQLYPNRNENWLRTILQAKDAEIKKAVEDFKNEVLDILENHTIVRSGDHPFVMKKVRCPENRTISDIRKDVKALPTHH